MGDLNAFGFLGLLSSCQRTNNSEQIWALGFRVAPNSEPEPGVEVTGPIKTDFSQTWQTQALTLKLQILGRIQCPVAWGFGNGASGFWLSFRVSARLRTMGVVDAATIKPEHVAKPPEAKPPEAKNVLSLKYHRITTTIQHSRL